MNPLALAALATAATIGGFANLASAETWNSNCESRVIIVALQWATRTNPAPGELNYVGLFQNQDPAKRTVTVTISRITKVGNRNVVRFRETIVLQPGLPSYIEIVSVPLIDPNRIPPLTPPVFRDLLNLSCSWRS